MGRRKGGSFRLNLGAGQDLRASQIGGLRLRETAEIFTLIPTRFLLPWSISIVRDFPDYACD